MIIDHQSLAGEASFPGCTAGLAKTLGKHVYEPWEHLQLRSQTKQACRVAS